MEVKNAPVESIARVMETLETFIAPKKVSQWAAITRPAIIRITSCLLLTTRFLFFHLIYIRMKILARSILYQTSGTASKEISAPSTAVKPQMKTIK